MEAQLKFKILLNVLSLVDQAEAASQNSKTMFSKKNNELNKSNELQKIATHEIFTRKIKS